LLDKIVKMTGARVAGSGDRACCLDLLIKNGRIMPFDSRAEDAFELDLSGHLILPGLINSHDHLEFNLYPRLGQGPHPSYMEWAAGVFHPDLSPLKEHLSVPKAIRLFWGGLKNLLSGVTTVCHHNPYEPKVFDVGFPVRVVRRFGWAHSPHFSPDFAERFAKTPRPWPFLLHAAEGTCARARSEFDRLEEAGVLSDRTVLVHGVALDSRTTSLLRLRGTSLIWCPSSNLFTLGKTLGGDAIRSGLDIALGTDSALTGEGDLIDEIGVAQSPGRSTAKQLFQMVTTTAARVLRLSRGEGQIREGGIADLVAVADRQGTPSESLRDMRPELVILAGRIKLVSRRLADRLPRRRKLGLEAVSLEGRGDYLVDAKVSELHAAVAPILGAQFRLAGRRVDA
jgi:cytosine/adenosine deaminase-related metal-dependent hydrolase